MSGLSADALLTAHQTMRMVADKVTRTVNNLVIGARVETRFQLSPGVVITIIAERKQPTP